MTRKIWIEIQKILVEKGIDVDEIRDLYTVKESILWGKDALCRESYTQRYNLHLKKAGVILNKRLSTHSYSSSSR